MIQKTLILCLFLLSFSLNAKTVYSEVIRIAGKVYSGTHLLRIKDKLTEGMIIEARGMKSFAIIRLPDGSRIMVKDGKIQIKKFKEEKTLIKLFNGILFSNKEPKGPPMEVETKQALLGVRGTKFFVQEKNDDTYLCVCSGEVSIKNDVNKIIVNKGEDAHGLAGKKMSKHPANLLMWDMASEGFNEMGIDVGKRPLFNTGPKKFKF